VQRRVPGSVDEDARRKVRQLREFYGRQYKAAQRAIVRRKALVVQVHGICFVLSGFTNRSVVPVLRVVP
jgi:hypothetical protein